MIAVIDHQDSFTHNLVRYLRLAMNDRFDIRIFNYGEFNIKNMRPYCLVLSPGPGHPQMIPHTHALIVQAMQDYLPILGICLGHQAIGHVLGAEIVTADKIHHGTTSSLQHSHHPIFVGLPNTFTVTRYHSLSVQQDNLPNELEAIALADDNCLMGMVHRHCPIAGLQYHPEALLTEYGLAVIRNFFKWSQLLDQ